MRVPPLPENRGRVHAPLFRALSDKDCHGELAIWGLVADSPDATRRWVAVSINQSNGDAPMIMTAVVSDQPITELEEQP